ncbi:GlsB/YeaQ/YmgE family stress response membrane protein [Pararhodobacter oceanensis]|uniref:GlsB/YeaQ/YmgE family stress response membrane protein n=1 Tax=Pararhodobacter oceanensis TaxID=2172121 RepID=A0A2T8HYC2_9RHOB|nr:GlsB/YeaQ/YmgE family stress response membrane protein [Pararhodobacter oceanensis]PVH30438.1 GlsB/YeaQ/YmgE family stress response membrane protein [Pararhodobacter oceanensis]
MVPGLLLLVVIGAAAGLLATRLMRVNVDLPSAMGIGVLGALFGGLVLRLILTAGGWMVTFVLAVAGAMALIWIWQFLRK